MTRSHLPTPIALAPLFGLLLAFYLARPFGYPSYYGLAQVAHLASSDAVVAPLCAAVAAWEAGRLRRGRVWSLAPVRSQLLIAWRELRWVWLVALATFLAGLGIELRTLPLLSAAYFLVLFVPAAVVISHSLAGYALGKHIPATFAVPLVLVASWVWLVYPISIQPLWVRDLTGYFSSCCNVSAVPTTGAYLAPILVSLGLSAASLIVLAGQLRYARWLLASVLLAAAIAGAVPLVSSEGAFATEPRSAADLTCDQGRLKTCVWPEDRSTLPLVATTARSLARKLKAAGVRVPPVVSEAVGVPGTWPIGVVPGVTRQEVAASLIEGLLPPVPACSPDRPYLGYLNRSAVLLWLARRSGAGPGLSGWTKPDLREVRAVSRLDRTRQLRWLSANLAALGACGKKPPRTGS